MSRILIRCGLNKYKTPLFSFDERGIYVRCKDCRTEMSDGTVKRGTFHVVPWSTLLDYMQQSGKEAAQGFVCDNGEQKPGYDMPEAERIVESNASTDPNTQS